MITTQLIFYSIAILIGVILYFFLRNKIFDKKKLQITITALIFSIFYFSLCISLINPSGLEVFSISANKFLHFVQIVPLIIIVTFCSLFWLKNIKSIEEKSTEEQKSKDVKKIFISFAASCAMINILLPPIHELWLKLVIMLGFGTFVGFIVALILWRIKKKKKT